MIDRIYRFITGTIRFTAKEGFQEMFLNECKKEGVVLSDAYITETKINALIKYQDYDKLLRAANTSGMFLDDIHKKGLPAFAIKNKKRFGIPLGLLFFSVILLILSGILWSIEVSGLETINETSLLSYLDRHDIKTGRFLSGLNCNEIEAITEAYGENILNVTANLYGCKLYIHVQEREIPDIPTAEKRYCNIIASKDGEVIKTDVFSGDITVTTGDTVRKGDLLVNGITKTPGGETRCVEAKARILAKTRSGITCQTAKKIRIRHITSVENRYAVSFFNLVFPPSNGRVSSVSCLSADTGILPVGIIRAAKTFSKEETIELPDQAAALISVTDLAVAASVLIQPTSVTECSIRFLYGSQVCTEAVFYCIEDICEQRFFNLIKE